MKTVWPLSWMYRAGTNSTIGKNRGSFMADACARFKVFVLLTAFAFNYLLHRSKALHAHDFRGVLGERIVTSNLNSHHGGWRCQSHVCAVWKGEVYSRSLENIIGILPPKRVLWKITWQFCKVKQDGCVFFMRTCYRAVGNFSDAVDGRNESLRYWPWT